MSVVTPMKLTPIVSNDPTTSDFQAVSTSEVSIKKQQDTGSTLTNLDSELLEILHNNTLSDDAKAKLYWIALHKSEIYKDKSMWSEPTIVELRENRFIPIPISNPITSKNNGKRKRGAEELLSNKRKKVDQSFSETTPQLLTSEITQQNISDKPSTSRKRKSSEEESQYDLKRMALINRIQSGHITPEEIEQAQKNIESPEQIVNIEPELTTGPLVVVGQQDQPQYVPKTPKSIYTPKEFSVSQNLAEKLQPKWLTEFYKKMDQKQLSNYQKAEIKNIVGKIIENDPEFVLNELSISTSLPTEIKGDPIFLFKSLIDGTQTRAVMTLKKYLNKIKVNYQGGEGLKNKIKKWVKL